MHEKVKIGRAHPAEEDRESREVRVELLRCGRVERALEHPSTLALNSDSCSTSSWNCTMAIFSPAGRDPVGPKRDDKVWSGAVQRCGVTKSRAKRVVAAVTTVVEGIDDESRPIEKWRKRRRVVVVDEVPEDLAQDLARSVVGDIGRHRRPPCGIISVDRTEKFEDGGRVLAVDKGGPSERRTARGDEKLQVAGPSHRPHGLSCSPRLCIA